MASCSSPSPFKFQSTLPQGKWPVQRGRKSYDWRISIHTSAREVTVINITELQKMRISIHTSAREVTISVWHPVIRIIFQSTLPQGKWQKFRMIFPIRSPISIHTSAREVTHFFSFLSYDIYISIHTSAREVTDVNYCYRDFPAISIHTSAREVTNCRIRYFMTWKFQSTLPQGKWHYARKWPSSGSSISIHTSAREVT